MSAATVSPAGPADTSTGRQEVAQLRLVCLVRSGDGYVVRGAGQWTTDGGGAAQVDISFGDAVDRRGAVELHTAVRHIQRWCELGTPVALLASGPDVTLRGDDGTAVRLPRRAA